MADQKPLLLVDGACHVLRAGRRFAGGVLLLAALTGCGGGGGSSSSPPPPPPAVPEPVGGTAPATPALAHCQGSEGGFFTNVTSALGLCYALEEDDLPRTELRLQGGGIALADANGDGRLDLYVTHGRNAPGRLFRFDGRRFVEVEDSGIAPRATDQAGYFVDVDEDGWPDLVSVQEEGIEIFLNDGDGRFRPNAGAVTLANNRGTTSMAAADYDSDGDLDLFFAHWGTGHTHGQTEFLWEQKGEGVFADVSYRVPTEAALGSEGQSEYSFTPVFADFDDDGDPDLLLASDFGSSQVLRNIAGGDAFTDLTTDVISDENGMGGTVADYDRDGDLDWFVSSIWDVEVVGNWTGNRLYRNDGTGAFEDATDEAGVREGDWGWGACFADFDNDGHVDLFHTNGYPDEAGGKFEADPSRLFMADGHGAFNERAAALGLVHTDQGRGVVCADYDDDGDVDVFIANNGTSPTVFRNDHDNGNGYLSIALAGPRGNPNGIGARVLVRSPHGRQLREMRLGEGYLSHGPARLHFGLGRDRVATLVEVRWPGPQPATSTLRQVPASQRIVIEHPDHAG